MYHDHTVMVQVVCLRSHPWVLHTYYLIGPKTGFKSCVQRQSVAWRTAACQRKASGSFNSTSTTELDLSRQMLKVEH